MRIKNGQIDWDFELENLPQYIDSFNVVDGIKLEVGDEVELENVPEFIANVCKCGHIEDYHTSTNCILGNCLCEGYKFDHEAQLEPKQANSISMGIGPGTVWQNFDDFALEQGLSFSDSEPNEVSRNSAGILQVGEHSRKEVEVAKERGERKLALDKDI